MITAICFSFSNGKLTFGIILASVLIPSTTVMFFTVVLGVLWYCCTVYSMVYELFIKHLFFSSKYLSTFGR